MSQRYFSLEILPRFNETDALGHINNSVIPMWNEAAREPVFKLFNPTLNLAKWDLIVAGFNISFLAPTHYGSLVTIKTWVSHVGRSSFEITQQSWQQGKQTSETKTTMVHYDYSTERSQPLKDDIKLTLAQLSGPSL